MTQAAFCALEVFLSGGTFNAYQGEKFAVVLTEHGHELHYAGQPLVSRGLGGVFTQHDTICFIADDVPAGEAAAAISLLRSVGARHGEPADLWDLHAKVTDQFEAFLRQRAASAPVHRSLSYSN